MSVVLLTALTCEKRQQAEVPLNQILAIVGQDTIYVNDFIRRSEFTLRPPYCQKNSIQDKHIILNSLIAEKLLALEAEADSALLQNEQFQSRLLGIKEQAMRERLIQKKVVDKIKISQGEIQQAYLNSQKTVYVEAILIPPGYEPQRMYEKARQGIPLEELARDIGIAAPKNLEIKWGHVDKVIQNAIFNNQVTKGTLLTPISVDKGALLIKVNGWSEEIEMSEVNKLLQMQNIEKSLRDYYVRKNYRQFAKQVMQGKRIDFFESGWNSVVQTLLPLYLDHKEPSVYWQNELPQPGGFAFGENIRLELFSVDGKVWRISDFQKEVLKHPLAIDRRSLTKENFPQRLRAAIAGLLTDCYLTELAYKEKMDRSYSVGRAVNDWRTFYHFLFKRDQYLRQAGFGGNITKDYFEAFDNYLHPYIDSLKQKYDSIIFFNPSALDSLDLTSVQMTALRTNQPYNQVVPPFPVVTHSVKCNYRRLEQMSSVTSPMSSRNPISADHFSSARM